MMPQPQPVRGEVLVRIHASAINPLDTKIRAGGAAHARQPLPAILGIDMAGIVEADSADVTNFAPGDAVYGMVGGVGGLQGTLADYAAVDARLIAHAPHNLSMREAAALPLVAITAWEGLVDRAQVKQGQTVLVQGGAGGVGHIAMQLAKALGAQVFGTGTGASLEMIAAHGATPIDYKAMSPADYVAVHTAGRGFDIVYDTVGGDTLDASFAAIGRFGHVVSALGWGAHALAPLSFKGGSYSGVFTLLPLITGEGRAHHGEILAEIARLVEARLLSPQVDDRRFDLAMADTAFDLVAEGKGRGKIVLELAE